MGASVVASPSCASSSASGHDAGADAASDADASVDARERDARRDARPDRDGRGPYLTALNVTAAAVDGAPPVAMTPSFSPVVHDYYVRCAPGTQKLTVSMSASPGADSLLLSPAPSPSTPTQTLAVEIAEGQAIVAAATSEEATIQYWVRCLPHDFPQISWTEWAEAGSPAPGYYLVGSALPYPTPPYAMVLDSRGVPVWYARGPAKTGVFDVDTVIPGAISYKTFVFSNLNAPYPFELRQLLPPATTPLAPDGLTDDEHELRRLPNGDFVVFTLATSRGFDLTGLKISLADGGATALGPGATIVDCSIVEFDPSGSIVWTWRGSDHFVPARVCVTPETLSTVGDGDGGPPIDVFHCNSIDVDTANGNLLVSARNTDSIFYVERSTGVVSWKMGGFASSKDRARYIPVADAFHMQHDARLQPGWSSACGAGGISMFDDETGRPGPSRAVLYQVTAGAAEGGGGSDCGSPAGPDGGLTATLVWQYLGTATSANMGSLRISSDGTRVIGWGQGTPGRIFTEVDDRGHALLELTLMDGNISYRSVKVPLDAFDLDALRNASGLP